MFRHPRINSGLLFHLLDDEGRDETMDAIGLYVHIPFCRAKCAYCDFNSYAGLEHLFAPYVRALAREIELAGRRHPLQAQTIYLGGGTPTVLPLDLLGEVLAACRRAFQVPEGAEVTVEANPGTVDGDYLAGLLSLGINRLSLGVQSFDEGELRLLGRIHTAREAVEACHLAREVGFDNLNLDLIYGIPRQTLAGWRETLRQALDLHPDHLSLYALTLEEHTPLAQRIARGEVPAPDDDLAAEMYVLAEETLAEAGYVHYEISNWARPGRQCRHNLTYWRNQPYLGFGAGAHSYFRGVRWWNVSSPEEYIARLMQGPEPAVMEAGERGPFPNAFSSPAIAGAEEKGVQGPPLPGAWGCPPTPFSLPSSPGLSG